MKSIESNKNNINKIISNLITGPIFAELKLRHMDKSQINDLISPMAIYMLAFMQAKCEINNNSIKEALKRLYKKI